MLPTGILSQTTHNRVFPLNTCRVAIVAPRLGDMLAARTPNENRVSDRSPDDLLYDHVLGAGCPCESLLNTGVFPTGWVDRYLELLSTVHAAHCGRELLPRRTVWAVNFASWYLPMRFKVWCDSGNTNPDTVSQLARIRTPSELFIAEGIDHLDG